MRSRFALILAGAGALLLLVVAVSVAPFHITVSIVPAVAEAGLPTTTPAPPTVTPPAPAAQTPLPTSQLPPTATPNVPPPSGEATATPEAPPATDVPSTTEKKDRPTPSPTIPAPSPTVPVPTPDVPQVILTKSVSARRLKPGDTVTYKLTLTNTGRGAAHDVVVTDQVPNVLQVVDMRTGKGDIVVDGQTVRAYPRTLNPDESVTYTVVVRVREGTRPMTVTNTGIVTISDGGDDPGDNSSSTDIEIVDDPQPAPPDTLPVTADPDEMNFAQQYWPLLMLIVMLMAFGISTRRGAFQTQLLRVTVGTPAPQQTAQRATPAAMSMPPSQEVVLDPQAIHAAWKRGTPTSQIVSDVASRNPHIDRARVSIAVQSVLNTSRR